MEFEQIKKEVEKTITPKRFKHSIGVVKRAEELANIYKIDMQTVRKVAIAHDIAKEMTKEQLYKYVKDNSIELDEIEKVELSILHSKIGADICSKRFGFSKQMQNAIRYHTTGNIKMDLLAKILYIADKTEDGRDFVDLKQAQQIANKDIDQGVLYVAYVSIQYIIKKKTLIHPDTISLINKLLTDKGNNKS